MKNIVSGLGFFEMGVNDIKTRLWCRCLLCDRIHDHSWWTYVSMLTGVTTAALVAYSRSIFALLIAIYHRLRHPDRYPENRLSFILW